MRASVIPEVAQRLSGTHEHLMAQAMAPLRRFPPTRREWVPDKPCGLSGMTAFGYWP